MRQYLIYIYQINTDVPQYKISSCGSCKKAFKAIVLWKLQVSQYIET